MGNQISGDGRKGKAKKSRSRKSINQGSVVGKLKQCQPPFSKFVLVPRTATAKRAVGVAGGEAAAGIRLQVGNNIVGTGGDSLGLGIPVNATGVLPKHVTLRTQTTLYGKGVTLLAYGTVRVHRRVRSPTRATSSCSGGTTTLKPESTLILWVGETLDVDVVDLNGKSNGWSLYSYTLDLREVTINSNQDEFGLPDAGGGGGAVSNASPVRHVGERGRGVVVATSGGGQSERADVSQMRPGPSSLSVEAKGDGSGSGGGSSGAKRSLGGAFADNTTKDASSPPAAGLDGGEDVPVFPPQHDVISILDDDDDEQDWPVRQSRKRSRGSSAPSDGTPLQLRQVIDLCDAPIDLCDSSDDDNQAAAPPSIPASTATAAAESIVSVTSSSVGNDVAAGSNTLTASRAIAPLAALVCQTSSNSRLNGPAVPPVRQPVAAAATLYLDPALVGMEPPKRPSGVAPASGAGQIVVPASFLFSRELQQQESQRTEPRAAEVAAHAPSLPAVNASRCCARILPREVCDWLPPRVKEKTPTTMDATDRRKVSDSETNSLDCGKLKAAARKRAIKVREGDLPSCPTCCCTFYPTEKPEAVDAHLSACSRWAASEAEEAKKGSTQQEEVLAASNRVGKVSMATAIGSHMPPSFSSNLAVGLRGVEYESVVAVEELAARGLRPTVALCDRVMQEMLKSRCRVKTECLRRVMTTSLEAFPHCWQPLNWGRFEETLQLLTTEEDPVAVNAYVTATNVILDCIEACRRRRHRDNPSRSGFGATAAAAAPARAESVASRLPPLFLGAGSDRDGRSAVKRCAKWAVKAWARRGTAVMADDLVETLVCMSLSRALAEALEALQAIGEGVMVEGGRGEGGRAAAARFAVEGCELVADELEAHRKSIATVAGAEETNARCVQGLFRSLAARPFHRVLAEAVLTRMPNDEGGVEIERLKGLLARHRGGGAGAGTSSGGEMIGSAMLFADMAR